MSKGRSRKEDTIGNIANTLSNRQYVTSIIDNLNTLLLDNGVIITYDYAKECIDEVIEFYEKYLRVNEQKLVSFDFYKIVSWYCIGLAQRLLTFYSQTDIDNNQNWIKVLNLCISRMIMELECVEKRCISEEYRKKIIRMTILGVKRLCMGEKDAKNKTLMTGIERNGLYMLMLMARVVEIIDTPKSSSPKEA